MYFIPRHGLFFVAFVFGTAVPLLAQMGDARDPAGTVQPPPPAEWKIPAAPVLSPEEALKSFRLPSGFRIEIVASEPLIHDPVALDFDADGRLWVIEMRSYMPDVDGGGESDRVNRVVVLEDTNHDGRMDKRTVYMDGLGLARAIKVLAHGVLIGDPPNLWLTRDTDGDGCADEQTAIATDFSLSEMNPEVGANALLWGLDNWISASSYGRRFRLRNGKWSDAPVVTRGQWGQSMDDFGRLFTNSSEDYLRVDLVSNHYPARNPNLVAPIRRGQIGATGVNHPGDSNQEVWPARVTAGVNRGYWDGHLRKNGMLKQFTAGCGPAVYRGDNFPAEFYGNYFAAEPSAHVVRRSIITEKGGILSGRNAYEGKEFLSSTDERFRPVNLYTAPDGTLYVVDMYRGILQHRQYMTTYLRRQINERGLDKPIGLGRIYRIVHESKKPGPQPALAKAPAVRLVETLGHPNGWWRDTAQRLLVERGELAAAPALRKLAMATDAGVRTRLQALWTLEGLGGLDPEILLQMMEAPATKLRSAAIRLAEPWLAAGDPGIVGRVEQQGRDSEPEVRLQVALSLGEAASLAREEALVRLLYGEADAPFMIPAAVSGLAGRELALLERLVALPEWREPRNGFSGLFEHLAAAILRGADETKAERLFKLFVTAAEPRWRRLALLNGIRISGVRNVAMLPRDLERAAQSSDPEIAGAAGELLKRLVWPGKFPEGSLQLTAAEQQLFEKGRGTYERICATCHQPDGRGQDGVALPLVDSKWVLGPDQILARIVLKGKIGRTAVVMPSLEMLSDYDLASALTYIRRSWGHEAAPVSPATVGVMRSAIIVRGQPYTDADLEALGR